MAPEAGEINVKVHFYSFFKDLAGCAEYETAVAAGSSLGDFKQQLVRHFAKLEPLQKSMLMAVGVEYQDGSYVLEAGDEVSLFPPVQGG